MKHLGESRHKSDQDVIPPDHKALARSLALLTAPMLLRLMVQGPMESALLHGAGTSKLALLHGSGTLLESLFVLVHKNMVCDFATKERADNDEIITRFKPRYDFEEKNLGCCGIRRRSDMVTMTSKEIR